MTYRNTKSIIMATAAVLAVLSFSAVEARDTRVKGYMRKDGTYVQPHGRTSPNSSDFDNYSTKGNSSPYTGNRGTVDPYQPKQRGTRSGFGG